MSRFGNQLKLRHDMKHIHTIAFLSLIATLTLTACDRNRHTPTTPDKSPLSFSALSQTLAVKADDDAFPHTDFGIWSITTNSEYQQSYVLWESSSLSEVTKNDSGLFIPASDAYWFSGYTYDFLAIAPWSAAESAAIDKATCTLTYDLASHYATKKYDFDLMAAVAKTTVGDTKPQNQALIFWHLLARIDVEVTFVDAAGNALQNQSVGNVSEIRMYNVRTSAGYTISYKSDDEPKIEQTTAASSIMEDPVTFNNEPATLLIHPQSVSRYEMYMDFELNGAKFDDFKVALNFPEGTKTDYISNEWYKWNIKIGPKAAVSFTVTVNQWVPSYDFNGDGVEDEIEIY